MLRNMLIVSYILLFNCIVVNRFGFFKICLYLNNICLRSLLVVYIRGVFFVFSLWSFSWEEIICVVIFVLVVVLVL